MFKGIFDPVNYYWNPWAVPVFFASILIMSLGFFVWSKNKKSLVNISYILVSFSCWIWLFPTVLMFASNNVDLALFWNSIIWIGIPFISTNVYFYSVEWLGLNKQRKFVVVAYIAAFIFVILALNSKHFISGGKKHFWGYYPEYGILSRPFLLFHFSLMIASFVNFINGYRRASSAIKKKQIKYVFIGYALAYTGSVDYLPALGIEVYPFGYVSVFLLVSILAYAIIRYKLMEIDTVIHKTFLWVLTSASVLLPIGVLLFFLRPSLESLDLLNLTLLVTVLFYVFLYYYRHIQPKIDHLFRRRKYDYYSVLAAIPQRIGSELNTTSIINRLFKELKEVLYIRNALILVQEPGGSCYTHAGSLGYESLLKQADTSTLSLSLESNLSKWLSTRQKALEREQVEVDPQFEAIKEEALRFFKQNSLEVVIPVVMETRLNALIGIGRKENLQVYTLKDIELLETIGTQIGITIDNALHHEDIVEKERLAEELRLGRDIQMNLLPKELPQIQGFSIDGLMLPAKEIGGDYYDFITLPKEDELAIVIGDVSGKGVAAGLLMAMAKTAIHTLSQENTSPKDVLLRTNSILYSHIGGQKFMTMLYFKYNPQDKTLTYSSAGHEHILIYHSATATVESIISGGFMLGMLADIEAYLEEHKITLEPKDKVLLYTDGVTDAENTQGERFGMDRLKDSFKTNAGLAPFELIHAIKTEVYTFIGQQPQYDDITLVGMEAGETLK